MWETTNNHQKYRFFSYGHGTQHFLQNCPNCTILSKIVKIVKKKFFQYSTGCSFIAASTTCQQDFKSCNFLLQTRGLPGNFCQILHWFPRVCRYCKYCRSHIYFTTIHLYASSFRWSSALQWFLCQGRQCPRKVLTPIFSTSYFHLSLFQLGKTKKWSPDEMQGTETICWFPAK